MSWTSEYPSYAKALEELSETISVLLDENIAHEPAALVCLIRTLAVRIADGANDPGHAADITNGVTDTLENFVLLRLQGYL